MVEDKHLIKCLRVSSSNKYLTMTSTECLIPHKHTLKILYKSNHFPRRYKRKRCVGFFSEHSVFYQWHIRHKMLLIVRLIQCEVN